MRTIIALCIRRAQTNQKSLRFRAKAPSGAGFSEWLRESVSDRAKEDARLLDLIRQSYAASSGVYGARRVFGDLREVGESCGLHRVERIMRGHNYTKGCAITIQRKRYTRHCMIHPS